MTFRRKKVKDDYNRYEIILLLVTQLGYIPIASTMLMTTYYEPSKEFCMHVNNNNSLAEAFEEWNENEFYSLTVQTGEACTEKSSQVTTRAATVLMIGTLIGSFAGGALADNFGRKPVVLGCLMLVCLGNGAICFAATVHWLWEYVNTVQLCLGIFCGGYMVSNFVLLTESFELKRSRLLAVSLNGWSISLIAVGMIAQLTRHWLKYHFCVSLIASILALTCHFKCHESCRWLATIGRLEKAKKVALQIASENGNEAEKDIMWYEVIGFSPIKEMSVDVKRCKLMLKNRSFQKDVFVMVYCFTAMSAVSFGYYFTLDSLPGNRFVNTSLMGLLKFITGFVPFFCWNLVPRRYIATFSIGICVICTISISLIKIFSPSNNEWLLVALALTVSAGMDPAWKISHLYTAEIFPIEVRSIARGVCNVGARLGSVFAPTIIHLRSQRTYLPDSIFALLLIFQTCIMLLFLPQENVQNARNETSEEKKEMVASSQL
ncbi:unnamed protein product [Caenorhabditis auriculariae]|uniref:Major facilitator superfamily (MFS) profile domain-containing protein n=1 Tax=Caenorhabditis auriculariae TaxID=2777116 RepID=A0A8S1H1N1_9PELO|nr:unnamed protein product [Caenorhabditis auriculariae]